MACCSYLFHVHCLPKFPSNAAAFYSTGSSVSSRRIWASVAIVGCPFRFWQPHIGDCQGLSGQFRKKSKQKKDSALQPCSAGILRTFHRLDQFSETTGTSTLSSYHHPRRRNAGIDSQVSCKYLSHQLGTPTVQSPTKAPACEYQFKLPLRNNLKV